jgi:hypothetical protein
MNKSKKSKRLEIKKVTMRHLDEPALDNIAGGFVQPTINAPTCNSYTCPILATCPHTCTKC